MKELRSEAAANTALQQATEKKQAGGTWMQPSKVQRKPKSTAQKLLKMLKGG